MKQGQFEAIIHRGQMQLEFAQKTHNQIQAIVEHQTIGNAYTGMGLYDKAKSHYEQAYEVVQTIQLPHVEASILGDLSYSYDVLGEHERAWSLSKKLREIAHELEDDDLMFHAYLSTAHLQQRHGQFEQSLASYAQARDACPQGYQHTQIEITAAMARLHQQIGNHDTVQQEIEAVLSYLETDPEKIYSMNPFRTYLSCYHVLNANHDPRAADILNKAYTMLQAWADRIENPEWRRSFLENVPENREIVEEVKRVKFEE
ncbi:MAG: tetratricopeptide repeat protein [Chloroflexota bacterium]